MSAAVARQQQQSGHGGNTSNPGSRIGSNSPVERRVKGEDKSIKSPTQAQKDLKVSPKSGHKQSSSLSSTTTLDPPQVAVDQPPDPPKSERFGGNHHVPPPPPPPGVDIQERQGDDYFTFNNKRQFDAEPNPFEQSFSNPQGEAQKTILPPASAITSPAPLIGGLNFMQSLRSGPLSPAMLQGPISSGHLGFESHIRSGLTPNESGIRSGLTPGGSGSMFPPISSPSPAGFLSSFNVGTPSGMEFQKTAITAAALRNKQNSNSMNTLPPPAVLTKQEFPVSNNDDIDHNNTINKPRQLSNTFDSDPAHHAANGLYMLAQAHSQHPGDQFNSTQPTQTTIPGATSITTHTETSPDTRKRTALSTQPTGRSASTNNTLNNVRGMSEMASDDEGSDSEESDDKSTNHKNTKRSNSSRRKTTDKNSNKRAKGNQGQAMSVGGSGDDQPSDEKNDNSEHNNKKMTDEEKRKNFLERNRVAALKCRQRKKQWLQNLQHKVELYSQENDSLTTQVAQLREEIVALKTLLLAHKDCPLGGPRGPMGAGIDAIHSSLAGGSVADYSAHAAAQAQANFVGMGVIPPNAHGHRRYS